MFVRHTLIKALHMSSSIVPPGQQIRHSESGCDSKFANRSMQGILISILESPVRCSFHVGTCRVGCISQMFRSKPAILLHHCDVAVRLRIVASTAIKLTQGTFVKALSICLNCTYPNQDAWALVQLQIESASVYPTADILHSHLDRLPNLKARIVASGTLFAGAPAPQCTAMAASISKTH